MAIVNSAAMNIGILVSFWIRFFSKYMPKSGIARAYGNFIFSFLRNLHVFHCDCTNLHSHQQSRRVHILLHSLQHLLFINFLMMAILTNVKWYHNIVLFAFLWKLGIMSIFSCTYCPSVSLLWRNVYLGLLPIILHWFVFCYWAVWAICIFWKLSFCQSHCLQIFFPS